MALAPVVTPVHAAVPDAPGVPPMVRVYQALDTIVILAADAAQLVQAFGPPAWGIFDQYGAPLLIGDSVIAIDYRREYRISDYPVEQGGFGSYDKVQEPYDVRVTIAVSGKGTVLSNLATGGALGAIFTGVDMAQINRQQFLQTMEAAAASLDLVQVLTPEASYSGLNIVHHDYRREARNGATLITVDIWLREVRITATSSFTSTQDPSGSSALSGGTVQSTSPTAAQAGIIGGGAPL
jgi:hypothetical protein